jgi:diguanylate cyclase (GGDEF)-like protein
MPTPTQSRVATARRIAAAAAALAVILAADVVTGDQLALAPFYLLVTLAVAWYDGSAAGWSFAGLCVLAMLLAAMASGHPFASPGYFYFDVAGNTAATGVAVVLATRLRTLHERERLAARSDPLTGLANRKHFLEVLGLEIERHLRYRGSFALAYIDVDDFKTLNDRHGHAAGDRLLAAIGHLLRVSVRRLDTTARLGGDEFVLLLPEADLRSSRATLEKLRRRLGAATAGAAAAAVTFSIGAVVFESSPASAEEALERADAVMYRAKREGKNALRVEVAGQTDVALAH